MPAVLPPRPHGPHPVPPADEPRRPLPTVRLPASAPEAARRHIPAPQTSVRREETKRVSAQSQTPLLGTASVPDSQTAHLFAAPPPELSPLRRNSLLSAEAAAPGKSGAPPCQKNPGRGTPRRSPAIFSPSPRERSHRAPAPPRRCSAHCAGRPAPKSGYGRAGSAQPPPHGPWPPSWPPRFRSGR